MLIGLHLCFMTPVLAFCLQKGENELQLKKGSKYKNDDISTLQKVSTPYPIRFAYMDSLCESFLDNHPLMTLQGHGGGGGGVAGRWRVEQLTSFA